MTAMTTTLPYYLGCPVWACAEWVGTLFRTSDRRKWLRDYSAVFNTVEGNSTFYGLPSIETVQRWGESTADGFRFALKFPRDISHECRLVDAERVTSQFVEVLETLDRFDRLGPAFLQLSPHFSGRQFGTLVEYLKRLPDEYAYAVEVRHEDYFCGDGLEQELNSVLTELGMDRCLFDSRPLFSRPPSDDIERESQRRKPRSPYRKTVTGSRPMLRFVGRNTVSEVTPWIEEWAPVIAGWIDEGLEPYIFAHSPNDAFAPHFACRLHDEIRLHSESVPALVPWPGQGAESKRQKSLF